jgi:hypothetical protein
MLLGSIGFKLLYGLVILRLERRRLVWDRCDSKSNRRVSGFPNFARSMPYITAVKTAFGKGFPRSNNVGCDRSSGSYSVEATTPHTVALSPNWLAASAGVRGAGRVGKAHDPNTADAISSLVGLILTSDNSGATTAQLAASSSPACRALLIR